MPTPIVTPYVNGRALPRRRRPAAPVTAPFDGRLLARVVAADEDDLDRAIAGARTAQQGLARMTRYRRAEILEETARLLAEERGSLARLISRDAGKPVTLADGEVARAIGTFRQAAEGARRFGVSALPADSDPRGEGLTATIERFPLGVISAIAPFNFPLNLVAHKVAPAFAAGNAIVLKPPPQAPLASFRLAELMTRAGAPDGALQVLHMEVSLAERLATDPAFAMLSFTGSARVGWHLKSVAGRKRVILELGGNAAVLVHSDAGDLDAIAARIAWGAFAYAGQVCIKVQRLYVHAPIYRRLLRRVVAATRQLPRGNPARAETVIGPLIDDAALRRVRAWVNEARDQGARTALLGTRRGMVLGPTILTDVRRDMKVSCEEVFGPVLIVAPYRTWAEGIRQVNDSPYGLQAGVYTHDARRIREAFRKIEVGGLIVNDIPTLRLDHLPYGGIKSSGLGREGVEEAMREMSEGRLLLQRD